MSRLLQVTCLQPNYSLRRQLLVAFGSISVVAIGLVMVIATVIAISSGNRVKSLSRTALQTQVTHNLQNSTEIVAETIAKKFDNLASVASIIAESIADRIVGYPHHPDLEHDWHIPFRDVGSGTNVYPLHPPPLPLEWNITGNVNSQNQQEHVQERFSFYSEPLSTAHGIFFMQGVCDPSETNVSAKTYYPNCTDANNNITTGGMVQPTSTSRLLAEKGAFLPAVLKPLYEANSDVKNLGVYFANSGAGSFIAYPSEIRNGSSSYISTGCDWMHHINPLSNRSIATQEEIDRCHKQNQSVMGREYNPLERQWCQDQALNPGKTTTVGPYRDAFKQDLWLLTFGRAIFDRRTGNFLGCTLLDVSIRRLDEILSKVQIGCNLTQVDIALFRLEDGIVVSSTQMDLNDTTHNITDLGLGIDYAAIKSAVDFDGEWNGDQVRDAFVRNYNHKGSLISIRPIPAPPDNNNDNDDETTRNADRTLYRTEFLVVVSVGPSVFAVVDETDEAINKDVNQLIWQNVAIGFVGMILVLCIILVFSIYLTRPLKCMERAAWQIVNATSDPTVVIQLQKQQPLLGCTPTTEITLLVQEFDTMIHGFSGDGAAKVAHAPLHEVQNTMSWQVEFDEFYAGGSADTSSSDSQKSEPNKSTMLFGKSSNNKGGIIIPTKINQGTNIASDGEDAAREEETKENFRQVLDMHKKVFSSKLFWWIMVLIVLPVLATIAAICTVVVLGITKSQPTWLDDVESSSLQLEEEEIETAALVTADLLGEVMSEPIRDLHILSRVAAWLLFGGLERSDSFTELNQASEQCKIFAPDTCPYLNTTPCDCSWKDENNKTCSAYPPNSSRYLQRRFYAGQSQDVNISNGDRTNTSYPKVDYSPNSTQWWDDVSSMPGAIKGSSASGHETTYDRVRVLSSLAVVEFPIYNHYRGLTSKKNLGTFVGLEADGMLTGWTGCTHDYAGVAHFQSSKENGAAQVRKDLCPLGKYGYDCRCRDWYDQGKKRSGVHITPPYTFANGERVAASATAALVDPRTGAHVGQALVDFIPGGLVPCSDEAYTRPFDIVITPETDLMGGDTVIAPGYCLGRTSPAISDVMLPHDNETSSNRRNFERDVLSRMKAGETGVTEFMRTKDNNNVERVILAFAPVVVKTLRPVNSSNFASGVTTSTTLVYSVGVAISQENVVRPFNDIDSVVRQDIDVAAITLVILIAIVSVLVTMINYDVAVSITGPVIVLLEIVRNINAKRIRENIPPMTGGSREVNQVYNSFAKLHKVLRFSNKAFFAGNLQGSYKFLNDAIALFRKLEDRKAIGIAANNLGNTITAMYNDSSDGQRCCRVQNQSVWSYGRQCFDEAIEIGRLYYCSCLDSKEHDGVLADSAEQLANRHFNRGLFFLLTMNDPCASENARELGYADLAETERLDREADDARSNSGSINHFQFDRILRRLSGVIQVIERGHGVDIWDVKCLIDEAERDLFLEWNTCSAMFEEVTRIGRLQQLEDMVVQYELLKKNSREALRIGMRMLIEDEFILELPFVSVSKALMAMVKEGSLGWPESSVSLISADLLTMFKSCKAARFIAEKNVVFCLDLSVSQASDGISRALQNTMTLCDACCSENDSVGVIPCNEMDAALDVRLGKKKDMELLLPSVVAEAMKPPSQACGTSLKQALDEAVRQTLERTELEDTDSWILVLTDCVSSPEEDVKSWISEVSAKWDARIHVLVIAIDVPNEDAKLPLHCSWVSDESTFACPKGSTTAIDEAFENVMQQLKFGTIRGGFTYGGVTMEKF